MLKQHFYTGWTSINPKPTSPGFRIGTFCRISSRGGGFNDVEA
jgi:hypothetical protein